MRALVLCGLVACGAPEPVDPVDPAIELGTGDIDFEQDLGIGENVDTFWVDSTWRASASILTRCSASS